jgi:hypothetical protein
MGRDTTLRVVAVSVALIVNLAKGVIAALQEPAEERRRFI